VNQGTGKGRRVSTTRKGSQPACPQADRGGARRVAREIAASVRRAVRMALETEGAAGGGEAGGPEVTGDEWVTSVEGVAGVTTVEEMGIKFIDMSSWTKD
jgi:hypothetical protein